MTNSPDVKITKRGVFIKTPEGRQHVAAPIRLYAIGERLDGKKIIEIRFVDCDGARVSELFGMSATIPKNWPSVADALGDRGYVWPSDGITSAQILRCVMAKMPTRRFAVVDAPGWYGDAIVTSLRKYGGDKRILIDQESGAHLAEYKKGSGSLKGWQHTVGKLATQSTGLRLAIAAAFAAPLLRPLAMDSFAMNLYAPTSSGKTTLLYAAASVPGLNNDEAGLPKWADSTSAIEQLAIGHRDGLLPLDESGDQDGGAAAQLKAKMLAFLFSRNKARTLDKSHQKKIKLTAREFRVIVLATSEFALKAIADAAGQPRIGGEEVRFIDVPVTGVGGVGVFDHIEVPVDRQPSEYGRELADNLRRDAEINQGFAMDAFLKKLTKDPEAALAALRRYMEAFLSKVSSSLETGPDQRIAKNFALLYGAAALAIDYGILPWRKKATGTAINAAMASALGIIRGSIYAIPTEAAAVVTIEAAAQRLKAALSSLLLLPIKKGERCSNEEADSREQADGFRAGQETLVKGKAWTVSSSDMQVLIQHGIIRKQRGDTNTVERKVMGISGKRRYYIVDCCKLAALTAGAE